MQHRGFITLISAIIATVVVVAVVIGILSTGISSGRIGEGVAGSAFARSYANACAEQALEDIREEGAGTVTTGDDNLSGTLSFLVDDGAVGSCSFSVIDDGNEDRTIQSTGESGEFSRLVEVIVSNIDDTITIASWQEVASF